MVMGLICYVLCHIRYYVAFGVMSFGIMSPSALCRSIRTYVVRDCVIRRNIVRVNVVQRNVVRVNVVWRNVIRLTVGVLLCPL